MCAKFLGDTDLPAVWVVEHNGKIRGVQSNFTDAVTQATVLANYFIAKTTERTTLHQSRDGSHRIEVKRYIVT